MKSLIKFYRALTILVCEIFPAMAIAGSSFYFEKYYNMPEVSGWRNMGNRIFGGNTAMKAGR